MRTLVAMATYIFHRFIKGKAQIDNFFCLNGDIWNLYLQKCLLRSPLHFIWLLSKLLNLIGYQGNKKVYFRNFTYTIRWKKLILYIHAYDISL